MLAETLLRQGWIRLESERPEHALNAAGDPATAECMSLPIRARLVRGRT